MPVFNKLSKKMQLKVRLLESKANELGKDDPETKELWNEMKHNKIVCGALNKKDGVYSVCLRSPVEKDEEDRTNYRCGLHGGKSLKGDEMTPAQKLNYMKNLRPDANLVHGLYSEEGHFIASLKKEEIDFMVDLENKVRAQYEVEEGLGDLILEGLLHDAVIHFRLINSGRLEKGSKHTAKPLMDIMRVAKEQGWTKKTKESDSGKSVLGGMIAELERLSDDKPLKRIK